MSTGSSKVDTTRQELDCPRDHTRMRLVEVEEATLDECPKCGGRFFDHGEMFAALGLHADPSYWDRPEATRSVKEAPIHCARCDGHMDLIELAYESERVEIDRCGHCKSVWLDKGEAETVMRIGQKLKPLIAAEREAAQKELDAMGPVDFNPGILARFLALFAKKK